MAKIYALDPEQGSVSPELDSLFKIASDLGVDASFFKRFKDNLKPVEIKIQLNNAPDWLINLKSRGEGRSFITKKFLDFTKPKLWIKTESGRVYLVDVRTGDVVWVQQPPPNVFTEGALQAILSSPVATVATVAGLLVAIYYFLKR